MSGDDSKSGNSGDAKGSGGNSTPPTKRVIAEPTTPSKASVPIEAPKGVTPPKPPDPKK